MRFRLIVRNKSRGEWAEEYDKLELRTREQIDAWCRETIERYNATMYEGDEPREYVRSELIGETEQHDWRKTNLVTVMRRGGGSYDTYRCEGCGITGKRPGLSSEVVRDAEFKPKGFASCTQSKVLLERRRRRTTR